MTWDRVNSKTLDCPHCGKDLNAGNFAKHERLCLVPRTIERMLEIAGLQDPDPDQCWIWPNARDGYGWAVNEPRINRTVVEITLGRPMKSGHYALHTCDNKACFNPAHVYEGTMSENTRDAWSRGLQPRERQHAHAAAWETRRKKYGPKGRKG